MSSSAETDHPAVSPLLAEARWRRRLEAWVDELRTTGYVVLKITDLPPVPPDRRVPAGDVPVWRRSMVRAAQGSNLRIRTGVTAGEVVWAYRVDHVTRHMHRAIHDLMLKGDELRPDLP